MNGGLAPELKTKVWDVASGDELLSKKLPLTFLETTTFSPDGTRLMAVSATYSPKLSSALTAWDVASGKEVSAFPLIQNAETDRIRLGGFPTYVFTLDGTRLAVCPPMDAARGEVRLYDTATGQLLQTFRDAFSMNVFQFSPDGKMLAGGGSDSTVRVWDLGAEQALNGAPAVVYRGHISEILRLGFHPDSSRLYSAGKDGAVKVWDVARRDQPVILPGATSSVPPFAFSATSGRIVTVKKVGIGVKLGKNSKLRTPEKTKITVCDLRGKSLNAFDGPIPGSSGGSSSENAIALSPDGTRLAIVSFGGGLRVTQGVELHVIEADTGKVVFTHKVDRLASLGVSLAFSRDGKQLACGLAVWPEGVAAGPPGIGPPRPFEVRLFDACDGAELRRFALGNSHFGGMAFSPNGKRLVTASGGKSANVTFWDLQTGERLVEPAVSSPVTTAMTPVFSEDGTRLACIVHGRGFSGNGDVVVWDAATGRTLCTLRGHSGPLGLIAFSPDGRRIATATRNRQVRPGAIRLGNEVKLWDTATGNELMALKDLDRNQIRNLAFSPDGTRLYAAGVIGYGPEEKIEIRTWDATPRPGR